MFNGKLISLTYTDGSGYWACEQELIGNGQMSANQKKSLVSN